MEQISIRNADIKILMDLVPIRQELKRLEEQCSFRRDTMFSISAHLSGMPKAKGTTHGIDDMLARLSETETRYRETMEDYLEAEKAAERVLNSIESVQMRSFVAMAYMQNKAKREIMDALMLTEHGYRKAREAIESAECMRDVVWREKYYCEENGQG